MRFPLRSALAAVIAFGLGSPAIARAAVPLKEGVRTDQFQPASPESPFFRSEAPHLPHVDGIEYAFAATLEYGSGVLSETGVDKAGQATNLATLIQNQLVTRVAASITPMRWLAFDVSLPVVVAQGGAAPKVYGGVTPPTPDSNGLGDPRLGLLVRPIDTERFGLLAGARFWAPVGSQGTYFSDGRFRFELDVGVAGELPKVLYGVTAGIAPGFLATRDGDRLALSAAGYAKLGSRFAVGVEPCFELLQQVDSKQQAYVAALFEPLVGVRFRQGALRFGIAAGPGLGGAGAAAFRGLLNVGFVALGKPPPAPPTGPKDRDLDGIPDAEDACPDDAGPPNKDPKKNGCPVHDRDGDGIPDAQDACPDKPGIPYSDPKGNGCPDSDNDGIPDPVDQCPNEPGPPPKGCPLHAHLGQDTFEMTPPIAFVQDDRLTVDGRASLEEMVATLRANPKIEQVSIGIGTKNAPTALSDKRAQQILLVLRAADLSSDRYEVVLRDDLTAGKVVVKLVK